MSRDQSDSDRTAAPRSLAQDSASLRHIEQALHRNLTAAHLEQALSAVTPAQGQGSGTQPTAPPATQNAPAPAMTTQKKG